MPENGNRKDVKKLPEALIFLIFVAAITAISITVIGIINTVKPAALMQIENPLTAVRQEENIQKTVILDAGHGGMDCGAVGRLSGVHEDVLNLDVAKRLKKILTDSGAGVIMTRENDDAVGKSKSADMEKRREIIQNSDADIVISIHMNFFSDTSASGPQVFYYEKSGKGRELALCIQSKMNTLLKPKSERVCMKQDYFILRAGEAPSALVECGFLSNREEEERLNDPEYRNMVANAIFEGIKDYFNSDKDEIIFQ